MSETNNKCPGCGRHCDLSAPNCPRGEAYARGEAPEAQSFEHTSHRRPEHAEENEHRSGHRHDHSGENSFPGSHHGHEGHGPKRPKLSPEQYATLSTDEKLGIQLRELGHMGRFHLESKGGQGRILHILAQEGGMTQRTLTEKLGIQPGSASEVIGKLERAGLVERQENAEDRRTSDIRLTELGRVQSTEASETRPDPFSALSEEEKLQLLTLLEKLSADWKARFPREHHGHGEGKASHHSDHSDKTRQ